MIAKMKRVMVVGQLSLMREVVAKLHAIGTLHISKIEEREGPPLERLQPGPQETAEESSTQKHLSRVEGIIHLLPEVGVSSGAAPGVDSTPAPAIGPVLDGIEVPLRELVKKRLEVEEEIELLEAYERAVTVLAPLLAPLEKSTNLEAIGFTVKKKQAAQLELVKRELRKATGGSVLAITREVDPETLGTAIAFHSRDSEKVRSVLSKGGVDELRLPRDLKDLPIREGVTLMQEKRRTLPQQRADIRRDIERLAREHLGLLRGLRNVLRNRLARLAVLPSFGHTDKTFVILGYNPARSLGRLAEELHTTFGNRVVLSELSGGSRADKTPVLLSNVKPVRPFEFFLNLLQRFPRYGTVDPTPLIALFFPLFFGMIVGDIGYGLIILALALFLRAKSRGQDPLVSISGILTVAGVWSVLFGVLYGELFGILGEHLLGLHPFVNRAAPNPGPFILGSILVGVIHVSLGFVVGIINAVRGRHTHHLVESAAMFLGCLALLVCLGVVVQLLPKSMMPWGLGAALVSMIVLAKLLGVVGPIEVVSSAGNVLSYARLGAFGLAGVYLVSASYTVFGEGARFLGAGLANALIGVLLLMVFVLIQFLVVALECLLSPTIQPARLHFVEFFTKFKFYDHSGEPYRPFRQAEQ